MKTEHQSILNARFLALVIRELSKNFSEEEIARLDQSAMLHWIDKGATLSELKIKAVNLLLPGSLAGLKELPEDPIPPLR